MATCHICKGEIGILDSTTSYYDERGNKVEVHTACKQRLENAYTMQSSPTMYTPETAVEAKDWTWAYLAGGVLALGLVVGLLMGVTRSE